MKLRVPEWMKRVPVTLLGAAITFAGSAAATNPLTVAMSKPVIVFGISVMGAGIYGKGKRASEAPRGEKLKAAFRHEISVADSLKTRKDVQ